MILKVDTCRKKNFRGIKYLILGLFLIIASKAYSQSTPQLGKSTIEDVIEAMTLQEKVKIVVGMGMDLTFPPGANVPDYLKNRGVDPDAKKYPLEVKGAAGHTHPIPRLGIPSIVLSDGPAGVRIDPVRDGDSSQTYYATAFPIARLLASSWDTSLVKGVGKAFGNEVREYGIDILLAPALNIHRNPLGGRNFEYYSEDPLIAGNMTAAFVKGVQSNGVGTSVKHFVANNQESNRHYVNTIVSDRALREIYLRGFEIAIKDAQPWTVMSSYNKVNGTYTSQDPELLNTVLRDEWGFKGFVMSDWFAGDNPVEQMKASNDLIMPGSMPKMKKIIKAVKSGDLDESVLDNNVEKVLNIILKSPSFKDYNNSNNPDLKAHATVARKAAAQGMILLKNQQDVLPVNSSDKIAVFGNASYDIIIGGTGSGEVNQAYKIQLTQGLTDAGYNLDQDLKKAYQQYLKEVKTNRPERKSILEQSKVISEMPVKNTLVEKVAKGNDVAIITLGRNAGEGADREQSDFYLNEKEKTLIKSVSKAFHAKGKKVIVLLNVDGVIEVDSWRNQVDGILLVWQPGQEAGNAIADVLSGKVDPSGRLATTFPIKYSDVPSSKNFPGTPQKKPQDVVYKEGIYNGYRYYDTFDVKPAYEFGYGLSYTKFSFNNVELSSLNFNGNLTVTTQVTNTGEVAGKEVVQLYISAPTNTLDKPAQELKGFVKTKLLEPGEAQTVTFKILPKDLASFNPQTSSWEAEAGTYTVKVGATSRDIRQSASFDLSKKITVEKNHQVLQAEQKIDELKPKNNQ